MIADHSQRQQALDPRDSFIIQAPAGSGKTELLVRRFLVLLAQSCSAPEEMIAITFTRKAANEMRHRVLSALQAATQPAPSNPHDLATWQLARAALEQDQAQQWFILNNPQRLRIQTIDAFCLGLTGQMPLLSGFGARPQNLPDADECYLQAARMLLESLEEQHPGIEKLTHLLLHLDNRIERIEDLLVNMLQRRDQWLPYLVAQREHRTTQTLRSRLENGLRHVAQEALTACYSNTPLAYHEEILTLLRFATSQLGGISNFLPSPANGRGEEVLEDVLHFPTATLSNRNIWLAIAHLLLTADNNWRKRIDKNLGFPAENKTMKQPMQHLLNSLQEHESLRLSLVSLRESPPPCYTEAEWKIVATLIELLPQLVAHLNVIFREQGVVDFNETTMAALRALGDTDAPTELALILDYQIKHLLVDEFQDTSTTQFHLLEKLTAGWQPGDGRTLFLVGDPMQSIYRFRQAEVGLFLKAQQEGLGSIQLKSLQLKTNFRSTPTIVNWINIQFHPLFPTTVDISSGAVTFNASVAAKEEHPTSQVRVHPILGQERRLSAEKICELIQQEQAHNPTHSIAVLVRSRSHLIEILPLLKQHHIAFNAVEIEPLATQSIVHDLTALTRALMHWGDRLAWLAILRAPWCGLSLADLHAVAGGQRTALIWERLQDYYVKTLSTEPATLAISADGQKRLLYLIPILNHFLAERERFSLRNWVEQTWIALNGPSCCRNESEATSAAVFFDLLEQLETHNSTVDPSLLEQKIHPFYATPEPTENCRLHIMTLHKAKGLEFDTVIIPHLESKSRSDEAKLLLWLDRPRAHQENDLLLAPIPRSSKPNEDPIYRYLQGIEKTKLHYEMTRLLYVAATRAKVNLHLITQVSLAKETLVTPYPNSFSALLWGAIQAAAQPLLDGDHSQSITQPTKPSIRTLRRLAASNLSNPFLYKERRDSPTEVLIPSLNLAAAVAGNMNKHIGILIHRCLQRVSQEGLAAWDTHNISQSVQAENHELLKLGLTQSQLEYCLTRIKSALTLTLNDPRGRWILDNTHAEQQSEYAITSVIEGKPVHLVIDRSFIDAQSIRWIIDYKTGFTAEALTPEFLTQVQHQHHEQLEVYARAIRQLEPHPIRLGLYFPDCAKWCEWSYEIGNYIADREHFSSA